MKLISIPIFILSFMVGIAMVYYTAPATRTVFLYPTPENQGNIQYIDKTGGCFTFSGEEVECPSDTSLIKSIPPQN